MPDEKIEKSEKKRSGFAVAAGLLFLFAVWFASLGLYLRQSMINYQPAPNEPKEGDMVSALLMPLMFVSAALCLFASTFAFVNFLFRRRRTN